MEAAANLINSLHPNAMEVLMLPWRLMHEGSINLVLGASYYLVLAGILGFIAFGLLRLANVGGRKWTAEDVTIEDMADLGSVIFSVAPKRDLRIYFKLSTGTSCYAKVSELDYGRLCRGQKILAAYRVGRIIKDPVDMVLSLHAKDVGGTIAMPLHCEIVFSPVKSVRQ